MANMREAIDLLHKARELIQRQRTPGHEPDESDLLAFLADSESFIAEGCGHKPRYWNPDPALPPYRRANLAVRATKDNGGTIWDVVTDDADADAFELYRKDTGEMIDFFDNRDEATEYLDAIAV